MSLAHQRGGRADTIPIVLIHAGVADLRMWDAQWPDLTAVRECVRLDLRGFGASRDKPTEPVSHSRDVIDTLHQLSIPRCHLVGASFGAGVATEVALSRPDLVRSLLLCPPGGSLLAELTPDLKRFFDAERAALSRDDLDAAVAVNVDTWVVGVGRDAARVDPAVRAAVAEMQRDAFEITAAWDDVDDAEFDPPALQRLSALAMPVLVLTGQYDLDATQDAARRVC
ncbi:MAG TPA: alpha/beta hydrolase, partial [Pseudonocardiaceae bacterium]|nr:alpha/beta hydrolase [Pseudonocardiaceae bacterium]